jgi:DNA repair ATPase RecN
MGSAAFLSGEGADHDGLRHIEKRLELEGLHKIRIKHPPLVLHHDGRRAMGQCRERRERSRHGFVRPNETKIEAHQLAEFFTNLPGSDRSLLCQQPLNTMLLDRKLVCFEGLSCDGSNILSGSDSGATAKHDGFKK